MQRVFEALSSGLRRQIMAHLAHDELNAGEIAGRFQVSKPAVSQHLAVLEGAGLVASRKQGQFVYYRLVPDALVEALNAFVREAVPACLPLSYERAEPASPQKAEPPKPQPTSSASHGYVIEEVQQGGSTTRVYRRV